jgi:hypothetical protein
MKYLKNDRSAITAGVGYYADSKYMLFTFIKPLENKRVIQLKVHHRAEKIVRN